MNEKEINIDYIGVVKENNGVYSFEQIEVQQTVELLGKLKAMLHNPNRTLMDMQECLEMHFKHSRKCAYQICPPYWSYSLAYIDNTCYPTMMEFGKYDADKQLLINKVKKRCNER